MFQIGLQLSIFIFCSGLVLVAQNLSGEGRDIAVVVRGDNPVDGLTLPEIRKLLLGEQQFWNSSLRVTLLLRAPVAVEREVVLRSEERRVGKEGTSTWLKCNKKEEST